MTIDPWLPRGFEVLPGIKLKRARHADERWQLYDASGGRHVLVVDAALAQTWQGSGLLESGSVTPLVFGSRNLACVDGGAGQRLEPLEDADPPNDVSECLGLATSIRRTRTHVADANLGDGIYVERLSLVLPGLTPSPHVGDDIVLGYWLTGGVPVSLAAERRLRSLVPWLDAEQLRNIAQAAGLVLRAIDGARSDDPVDERVAPVAANGKRDATFSLPGRPTLEAFFVEHVIDIVQNEERYRALGVGFPGAVLLHGPPGSGKTFAVDRLVDFLDWPRFSIEAGTVGSPYIHETSRKIAEVFKQASAAAPSVIVMDEIDAFLSERESGVGGQHRVEEISEFLRLIPQAAQNRVLLIGMTNRLEALDKAIIRRGRFDHILDVGMPSAVEIEAVLTSSLSTIPTAGTIDTSSLSLKLAGRPMSDAAFVIREGCRLAARDGATAVSAEHLDQALAAAAGRDAVEPPRRRIGFV